MDAAIVSDPCHAHYRPAVRFCPDCGRGLCGACSAAAISCRDCGAAEQSRAALAREKQTAMQALRRAGYTVPRAAGDPVVLRRCGPLGPAPAVAAAALAALAVGAAVGVAQDRWQIGTPVALLAVAACVGVWVRLLFGGVSRTAGVFAALLGTAGVTLGAWLTGTGRHATLDVVAGGFAGPTQTPLRQLLPALCIILAAALAYRGGAGRRLA